MESRVAWNRKGQDQPKADQDRYRFLLENSGDILWTIDLEGRWQYMTRNVERVLHLKLIDILKKTVWDFIAPEYVPVLKEKMERRLRGEDIPPYEVIVINGYGERVPFEVKTSPLRNEKGEIIGIQGISRDITERKRAEEAAQASEDKFRNLIENINDWVWEIDNNGIFSYSSPRVLDYLGYRPEEVIGRSIYSLMDPERARRLRAIFDGLAKRHMKFAIAEKTLIGKDGQPVDFEMNVSAVYNDDGTLRGFRGICRDIRDRKRAEEKLKKAYEELEERVRERTHELGEAKARAELYVDLMSHDINNMNMMVMGYIEMALNDLTSPEADKLLGRSIEILESSSRLIENVRKLQKAESKEIKIEIVDLCDIIRDAIDGYSNIPNRDIRIHFTPPDGHYCSVMANVLLKDVFSNLLDNAIKHSAPDRPLAVDIRVAETRKNGAGCYRVTIEDNGPGIPDELKGRLFTRWQRGVTKVAGKGLGLYLVRALVEDFGGKVWAEDRVGGEPGKGSRFVVMLPAPREGRR